MYTHSRPHIKIMYPLARWELYPWRRFRGSLELGNLLIQWWASMYKQIEHRNAQQIETKRERSDWHICVRPAFLQIHVRTHLMIDARNLFWFVQISSVSALSRYSFDISFTFRDQRQKPPVHSLRNKNLTKSMVGVLNFRDWIVTPNGQNVRVCNSYQDVLCRYY